MMIVSTSGNRPKTAEGLFLRNLDIINFGGIKQMRFVFDRRVSVLDKRIYPEVLAAIGTVLKINPLKDLLCCIGYDDRSVICAGITANGVDYTVTARCRPGQGGFDCHVEPATADGNEFYRMIHVLPEEETLSVFGKSTKVSFSLKLLSYLEKEKYYTRNEFLMLTEGAGETRLFRKCLRDYIRNYVPEKLPGSKNLIISVADNGRFFAENEKTGEVVEDLNETERMMFEYICFLKVNGFWKEFQEIRDMNHMDLPLFVSQCFYDVGEPLHTGDNMIIISDEGRQVFVV